MVNEETDWAWVYANFDPIYDRLDPPRWSEKSNARFRRERFKKCTIWDPDEGCLDLYPEEYCPKAERCLELDEGEFEWELGDLDGIEPMSRVWGD